MKQKTWGEQEEKKRETGRKKRDRGRQKWVEGKKREVKKKGDGKKMGEKGRKNVCLEGKRSPASFFAQPNWYSYPDPMEAMPHIYNAEMFEIAYLTTCN